MDTLSEHLTPTFECIFFLFENICNPQCFVNRFKIFIQIKILDYIICTYLALLLLLLFFVKKLKNFYATFPLISDDKFHREEIQQKFKESVSFLLHILNKVELISSTVNEKKILQIRKRKEEEINLKIVSMYCLFLVCLR